jgi:hypothetical protein
VTEIVHSSLRRLLYCEVARAADHVAAGEAAGVQHYANHMCTTPRTALPHALLRDPWKLQLGRHAIVFEALRSAFLAPGNSVASAFVLYSETCFANVCIVLMS